MRTPARLFGFVFVPVLLVSTLRAQTNCTGLVVTVSPDPAPYGQPITVTVSNPTAGTLSLIGGSCAFSSINQGPAPGTPVVGGNCTPFLVNLPPNGQVSQVWDQKNSCAAQVPPGLYNAAVNTLLGGACYAPFTIASCPAGSWSSFGAGCLPGDQCSNPATLTLESCPQAGSTAVFRLADGAGAFPAVVALGGSNTSWLGAPLPINLPFGCQILISPDLFLPAVVTSPIGLALFPVPIPADPFFVGTTVYAQGGTGSGSNQPHLTNALSITIG